MESLAQAATCELTELPNRETTVQANRTMQIIQTERPALGLLSRVAKLGAAAMNQATSRTGANGTKVYQTSPISIGMIELYTASINQHDVKPALKRVSRFNWTDWKHRIRRLQMPRVANG